MHKLQPRFPKGTVAAASRPVNKPEGRLKPLNLVCRVSCLALTLAVAMSGFLPQARPAEAGPAIGQHAMAATGHPLATEAALAALRRGGNAVDGAVAAALTLGVVDGHNSGLGGGCLMLLRLPDGRFVAVDGRETAPGRATRDMFLRAGKPVSKLSLTGALAMGVPGALAAYDMVLTNFGRQPLSVHLEAAAELAERGFPLSRAYARRLKECARELRAFPSSRAVFFKQDGSPYEAGEQLRQPDLAKTYRAIARHGSGWFYGGPFAEQAAAWSQQHGGVLSQEDFLRYAAKQRTPVITTYRGLQIASFPPPSSGGILLAQMLGMLEPYNLQALGADSADFIHLVTEVMKLAFADRAAHLGDADQGGMPAGVLEATSYIRERAKLIRMDRAMPPPPPGAPERAAAGRSDRHTTHFSIADAEGHWVACTATINTSFGSKVVIPGTGLLMNNEMDDFSLAPGTANYFGLLGGEANAVAPGKRPLSSMSPTLVLKNGQPLLGVGAAGGPTIISQTLLAILHTVDFGMPVDRALAAPRFHHQWQPDELRIEKSVGAQVRRELERRGQRLKVVSSLGAAQAVGWDARQRLFTGAADPRGEGRATGY